MPELIIVQPWFTAVGHPAQSLTNTAQSLGDVDNISYLISQQIGIRNSQFKPEILGSNLRVDEFGVNSPSLREGTLKALFKLCRMSMQGKKFNRIFFFDVHMALLAGSWCFFSPFLRPQRLSMIYLMGPERIKRSKLVAWLTIRLLQRKNVILYLRTEELVDAWHQTFPTVPAANIRYLPSLELPDISEPLTKPADNEVLKFGILGQIRQGKGLEWLVPLFLQDAELGKLSVAGAFNNGAEAKILGFLNDFDGFKNGFLSDEEMLAIARQQHYLLMLYDNWDARMESAVLYLAARANRPVIAYGKGWCGRQIRQYQNGLIAPENQAEIAEFVKAVPKPGSQGYDDLLAGVARFRRAHSPEALRERYLNELMN